MIDQLDIAERVILLYQQGRPDAARHYLDQVVSKITDEITETQHKLAALQEDLRKVSKWNRPPEARPDAPTERTSVVLTDPDEIAVSSKARAILDQVDASSTGRRKTVIQIAIELALVNPDRQVSTATIAEEIRRRNIDLKVDPQRIGTSIGNFVFHNPEFELVAPGLYRLKGKALDFRGNSGEPA